MTDFTNTNLEDALFWGVDLRGVNFKGANLKNTRIIACDIRSVRFSEAACLDGLDLTGSVASKTPYTDEDIEKQVGEILAHSKEQYPKRNYEIELAGRIKEYENYQDGE